MNLSAAIAHKISTLPTREVRNAFSELSEAYRKHEPHKVASGSDALFLAYIAARMPATLAVISRVLSEYVELGGKAPQSLLDIGAGPGTASFAALEFFEELHTVTLIEREPRFAQVAKELAHLTDAAQIEHAKWLLDDATKLTSFTKTDLAIASYSLGEMGKDKALQIAERAFDAARLALIVVEPGTPQGFEHVLAIRDHLISKGAHVAAPCPHQKACPMSGSDFCHFATRVERTKYHRDAKGASLPYEDEKFAYVILMKEPRAQYESRIVKRLMRGSGHVTLDLCTDGRLERRVVARSDKELYKKARKVEWGQCWP